MKCSLLISVVCRGGFVSIPCGVAVSVLLTCAPVRRGGGLYATSDDEPCDVMEILDRNMVPFPYKTAKALDGTHYRNLPQDVWTELVKGAHTGSRGLSNWG